MSPSEKRLLDDDDDDKDESEKKKCKTNSSLFRRNIRPLVKDETLEEKPSAVRDSEEKRRHFHLDDRLNVPDENGQILINVHHPTTDPDVFVNQRLTSVLKAHQIGGIRFLYDNIIESIERFETNAGLGCILAHSMGCGKTLQIIVFLDALFRFTTNKTVLIIVPVNTLENWLNEFRRWSPEDDRPFRLYFLNEKTKNVDERKQIVENWTKTGGTLIIGYEMFRLLVTQKNPDEIGENLCRSDLVVCDEGHRIKNHQADLFKALKSIRTRRRIVLTGYPLQNNLIEFWSLIDFVRPNFLGTKQRFANLFERPIVNGRCSDSTVEDQRIMRERAHILHSLLEKFVQRRGPEVLRTDLPSKNEFVLPLKMTEIQEKLYENLVEKYKQQNKTNVVEIFAEASKIWNHPDVFRRSTSEMSECLADGTKFVVAMKIIDESIRLGDKVLLFSQSLLTLDKFEEFLVRRFLPDGDQFWTKNRDFSRLDGKTRGVEREKLIRNFNDQNSSTKLFLLSTRAACLGVNLIGANRVIMMDVSWNPCHDAQAVCRVYRYGQEKNCYIYRLIADGTMEKGIYDRQVTKQNMSDRVVDEIEPENHFTRDEVENLLQLPMKTAISVDFLLEQTFETFNDEIFHKICQEYSQWFCQLPFTHESLLIDQEDFHLSFEEKRRAKEKFENQRESIVQMKKPDFQVETTILSKPLQIQLSNSQREILPVGSKIQILRSIRGTFIRTIDGKIFGIRSQMPSKVF